MSRPVLALRFTAIDETRALAIFSMIIMHFGPVVFQRLPVFQPMAEPILFLGRFAITTFVLVFGARVGFVYFDCFRGPNRQQVIAAVRSRLRVLCALLICVPDDVNLWLAGHFSHWLFKTYSILNCCRRRISYYTSVPDICGLLRYRDGLLPS